MSRKKWMHCIDELPPSSTKCFIVARRSNGEWDCSFAVWEVDEWVTRQGDSLADALEQKAKDDPWRMGCPPGDCSHFRRLEKIYWARTSDFDDECDNDAALNDFLSR